MTITPSQLKTLSIELPESLSLQVTQGQFKALAIANQDLRLERSAAGELIVNPPTGWETGERNRSLTGQLDRRYEDNDGLGKAFDSSTGFRLPNGATRFPDASWVSQGKTVERLTEPSALLGEDVLPGFVLNLGRILT